MYEAFKTLASREENDGYNDRLTSVANRSFFYDKLANLLNASSTADVVLIKIDVARFHEINACYGYEIGDVLLIQVAERLSKLPGGMVGRLAADEFALAFSVTGLGELKIDRLGASRRVAAEICYARSYNRGTLRRWLHARRPWRRAYDAHASGGCGSSGIQTIAVSGGVWFRQPYG